MICARARATKRWSMRLSRRWGWRPWAAGTLTTASTTWAATRDRHTHIGEGCIGDEGFRHLLNDPRWAGVPLLLETPKDDDPADDIRNQKRLMGLVEDASRVPVGLREA